MTEQHRSATPLVIGLILVIVGGLFLTVRLVDFDFAWGWLRFVLPILLMAWGLSKLIRHFLLDTSTLVDRPGKAGLLGGFFWTGVGLVWLLDLIGVVEGFEFFGLYWPVLLILFGLGKIVDYYRSQGRLQVRVAEIFGVIFLVLVGLGSGLVAEAQLPLISFPAIDLGRGEVSIDDWFNQKFTWTEQETTDAEGIQSIEIDNLYGDVIVEGHESGLVEVELTKAVLAATENEAQKVADRVQLKLARDAGLLRIGTNRKEVKQEGKLFKSHLKLKIPSNRPLTVTNRHGGVRVEQLGADCAIKNAYGDVVVEDLTGSLQVANQYRRISLRRVEGRVTATNDRGSIVAEDGIGAIEAGTAYEAIVVRRQEGNVQVKNRFGRVTLESVSGTASVESPGSEISISEVEGAVTLSASHKTVTINDLGKGLNLDTSSNRVSLTQVSGLVQIHAAYSDIRAAELEAGVQVEAKGTRVSVEDLEGGFDIASSTRPVRVVRFAGGGRIQNEYGEIELIADRPPDSDITLSTKNAAITLVIPEDTGARISAQAPGGRIRSEFTREAGPDQELSVLDTQIGQGGPRLRLQTNYASIYIRKFSD